MAKTGAQFFVTKGTGYVGGIRADLPANRNITVPATVTKVWADVSLQGNITSQWEAVIKITVAPTLENYSQNGFMHYVFAVASIDAAGNITDLRPKGSLTEQETSDALAQHEKSRNHPDGTLTGKGFVQMSSATDSDSETLAATLKAVKIAMDNATARLAKDRNGADIPNPALFRQNLALKDAALVDIGKTAGTAAAGDDTRIVNAISIKDTNIQLPGNLGVKNLEVYPMTGSAEGGQIDIFDKDGKRAAFIDIDSAGNYRLVTVGAGAEAGGIVSLVINRATGDLSIPKTLTATGDITSAGIVRAGNGASWMTTAGNVYGTQWGGLLSSYLSNRTVRAWAAVRGDGAMLTGFGFSSITRTNVGGYNFTMTTSNGAYAVTVGINAGAQGGGAAAHSPNIWNRTANSFSIQNSVDSDNFYPSIDWPEFYVIVVGP